MTARMDGAELRSFATHLGAAHVVSRRKALAVLHKGANNIKNQMRDEASKSKHFGQIAPTISYDIIDTGAGGGGWLEAEIGPNRHFKSARIANIAYFGGANGGGGTLPDPINALLEETPRFESAVADIAEDAI